MFNTFLLILIAPCLSMIIQSKDTKHCMRSIARPIMGGKCCETCDYQNWIFEEHPDLKDYYKIINAQTNRVIDNTLGTFPFWGPLLTTTNNNNNDSDSKYWKLIFDDEDNPTSFKMVNLARPNECIQAVFVSLFPNILIPGFGEGSAIRTTTSCTDSNDNAIWEFIDDYDIINVDFNLDAGEFIADIPLSAGSGICNNANGGSLEQEITVIVSETRIETSSFERSSGFEISVGTTFKTGIPFVAEGEISTEISTSSDFTFGEETSIEKQFQTEFPVRCGPGEIISVDCIIFTAEIDVPYTMTILGINSGIKFESNGIFRGVSVFDFVCDFERLNTTNNKVLYTEEHLFQL